MERAKPGELLLGKQVAVLEQYSPELLYPIPRAIAREALGIRGGLPFHGEDLWHAYELSWLNPRGKPEVRVGRFYVPADSPSMIESKSFKLYLNSLNGSRLASEEEVLELLQADLSAAAGAAVRAQLLPVDAAELAGAAPKGALLDGLDVECTDSGPSADLLAWREEEVEEAVHSHLLRSLCPVTGQPDWATVWLRYRGRALDHASLLRYLVAYRNHHDFHEQCVERMFVDIYRSIEPELLEIQAFYTRRGGLDINPFRSTEPAARARPRMNRQ